MNDDLGSLVSQFVEERVDRPQPEEVDLWSEAVYAALFSVAFETVTRLSSARGSLEDLERETNGIIEATCAHASSWVNARLSQAARQFKGLGLRVQWDVAPGMRGRMVTYFDIAYSAMADRGYEKGVARSHACFVILSEAISHLVQQQRLHLTEEEASRFLRKALEVSESMSREIGDLLDSKARSLSAKTEDHQSLDDIPIALAEAIEAVHRQAERFASARGLVDSGLMPEEGDLQHGLSIYNERFARLKMKLEIIPRALEALRSIDRRVQPQAYRYMVTLYLDVLKYDIRDASFKSALRRSVERLWKRATGQYP